MCIRDSHHVVSIPICISASLLATCTGLEEDGLGIGRSLGLPLSSPVLLVHLALALGDSLGKLALLGLPVLVFLEGRDFTRLQVCLEEIHVEH